MSEYGEALLEVKGLCKSFGEQTVLDGIDFRVARGETLAVLGRSGMGKSVLLKLLIRLEAADSGSIRVFGQEITTLDQARLNEVRKRMGFLFQQAALYDSMNIEDNVAFPLRHHTNLSDSVRRERARELLASVGLERDLQKLPSEISGGMQKRAALARALALDPEILLFDEPTAGLDPITAEEIGKLILELKQRRAITSVLVTHDIQVTRTVADRLVLMNEGNIVAEGTFEDLKKGPDQLAARFLRESS